VCGSSARTDLCGGRSAMIVPTATEKYPSTKTGLRTRGRPGRSPIIKQQVQEAGESSFETR
jgi:hypothetical protein